MTLLFFGLTRYFRFKLYIFFLRPSICILGDFVSFELEMIIRDYNLGIVGAYCHWVLHCFKTFPMNRAENVYECVGVYKIVNECILTLSIQIRTQYDLHLVPVLLFCSFSSMPKKSQFLVTSTWLLICFISIHNANIISNTVIRSRLRDSICNFFFFLSLGCTTLGLISQLTVF